MPSLRLSMISSKTTNHMAKFKKGDRVVLLKDYPYEYGNSYIWHLEKGEIGTVVETINSMIKIIIGGYLVVVPINIIEKAP